MNQLLAQNRKTSVAYALAENLFDELPEPKKKIDKLEFVELNKT